MNSTPKERPPWQPPNGKIRRAVERLGAPVRRKAKKRGAWVNCPAVDFVYALLLCQCIRVSRCIGVPFTVDHVEPIAAGGKHRAGNLQVLPRAWNEAKGSDTAFLLPDPYRNP